MRHSTRRWLVLWYADSQSILFWTWIDVFIDVMRANLKIFSLIRSALLKLADGSILLISTACFQIKNATHVLLFVLF
jgi:hypothetical protein